MPLQQESPAAACVNAPSSPSRSAADAGKREGDRVGGDLGERHSSRAVPAVAEHGENGAVAEAGVDGGGASTPSVKTSAHRSFGPLTNFVPATNSADKASLRRSLDAEPGTVAGGEGGGQTPSVRGIGAAAADIWDAVKRGKQEGGARGRQREDIAAEVERRIEALCAERGAEFDARMRQLDSTVRRGWAGTADGDAGAAASEEGKGVDFALGSVRGLVQGVGAEREAQGESGRVGFGGLNVNVLPRWLQVCLCVFLCLY